MSEALAVRTAAYRISCAHIEREEPNLAWAPRPPPILINAAASIVKVGQLLAGFPGDMPPEPAG